ncbi:hypothetical protein DP117_30075 [Brasilonema sp. UFV-L1]|nr:hypothetical protein [Brasilonema sp. UFV-L1]
MKADSIDLQEKIVKIDYQGDTSVRSYSSLDFSMLSRWFTCCLLDMLSKSPILHKNEDEYTDILRWKESQ